MPHAYRVFVQHVSDTPPARDARALTFHVTNHDEASQGRCFAGLRTMRPAEEAKQFFFEKKNQKTFASLAYAAGENRDSDAKVFCFFSSEKKALLRG